MSGVMVVVAAVASPFGQLFLADPGAPCVPVLPAAAVPRIAGGWLPNPPPPSEKYILAAAATAGRQAGDIVVSRELISTKLDPVRQFTMVGKGRLWELHYECKVFGPDGPLTIYVDRAAIVLAP